MENSKTGFLSFDKVKTIVDRIDTYEKKIKKIDKLFNSFRITFDVTRRIVFYVITTNTNPALK